MPIRFIEIHAAKSEESLNDEWITLENTGPNDFVAKGCKLTIGKGAARGRPVGTLDPGFVLHAGEKIRLVTGNPGKKAQGAPPEPKADCKNYHLFLGEPMLEGPGTVVRLVLNQLEMAKATYDAREKNGVGSER
jgi:hypothetical protein